MNEVKIAKRREGQHPKFVMQPCVERRQYNDLDIESLLEPHMNNSPKGT